MPLLLRRSRSIQPYPLPHYPLTPSPTHLTITPSHPPRHLLSLTSPPSPPSSAVASLLPAVAYSPPHRRISPHRRLSLLPAVASLLPAIASPPPRRRLSSSPPSHLLLPRRRLSPPPRRRLSLLPTVASPSSPPSPLAPPRGRLSPLPGVASPSLPGVSSGDRCTSASAGWCASAGCFLRHRGYQKKEMECEGERVRI
ncbi:unnamed protein product [Closterium sp. NIES-64]|nr:unnamed protein product [Closterium sp. NIES-64]